MARTVKHEEGIPSEILRGIKTPCHVLDIDALRSNLEILSDVSRETGASILLALKSFAMFEVFPLISKYLSGTSASSLNEARLGYEKFKGEVHACAPAYAEEDFKELLKYVDHIVFNSFSQWRKYRDMIKKSERDIECGIRVNPEHSEVKTAAYDPCGKYSRLGVTEKEFSTNDLDMINGLHFHALCELNSDALERTLNIFEKKFGSHIKKMKWVNFGGGHHITRPDYDINRLCRLILSFSKKYDVKVYIEPGEAVVLNAGYLVGSVLDIVKNVKDIAILDTSASAHMPDVLEMPYRPVVVGAEAPGEYPYNYLLAGNTCLAGDVIGEYSFPAPLKEGSKVVFTDMAHYTMVKNTTFNGVSLPSLAVLDRTSGTINVTRKFGYEDYLSRMG